MAIHLLGIRHHGPGSAKHVLAALEALKPDIVLIEGPPEADALLTWANNPELVPPIAILCYQPDQPQRSVFYPFAEFSPEWQAIQYARKNNLHVRFFDLPISNQLGLRNEAQNETSNTAEAETNEETNTEITEPLAAVEEIKTDPVSYLATAAGYEDGEKWWEQMFEHRQNGEQVFDAVQEAMQVLRTTLPERDDRREQAREAHMRKMIRQAEREMFENIAVVCGAWHVPALSGSLTHKNDAALLKNLPKVKIETTWVPWTYGRLSYNSGYGAGIQSPGWYEHVWTYPEDDGTRWMSKVAQLFRNNNMDTSVAHVIEAVRLAETLASMRGLSKAGLEELNESTLSVLCNGESILLKLINDQLVVSNKLGSVPEDIPRPPLQVDIEKAQKRLRLPASADFKDYTLDLRKETDLERSILLHRLNLLGISWGKLSEVSGKGTFKEQWRLEWQPEFSVDIIEKGGWGNTVEAAASRYVVHQANQATNVGEVAASLEAMLPAELQTAVEVLIQLLNNLAAASGDVVQLMEAVPSLVQVSRYGNVRKTDAALVTGILQGLITRICVGLPNAVSAIDDDAAEKLLGLMYRLNDAVNLLAQDGVYSQWQQCLAVIADNNNASRVVSGYSVRLLFDFKVLQGKALVKTFSLNMSGSNPADRNAAWLEGFLKGSGTILLLDDELWSVINTWVKELDEPVFIQVLPLLRRTFANFTSPERRKLGEKVKSVTPVATHTADPLAFNADRGRRAIPIVLKMLGLSTQQLQHEQ